MALGWSQIQRYMFRQTRRVTTGLLTYGFPFEAALQVLRRIAIARTRLEHRVSDDDGILVIIEGLLLWRKEDVTNNVIYAIRSKVESKKWKTQYLLASWWNINLDCMAEKTVGDEQTCRVDKESTQWPPTYPRNVENPLIVYDSQKALECNETASAGGKLPFKVLQCKVYWRNVI